MFYMILIYSYLRFWKYQVNFEIREQGHLNLMFPDCRRVYLNLLKLYIPSLFINTDNNLDYVQNMKCFLCSEVCRRCGQGRGAKICRKGDQFSRNSGEQREKDGKTKWTIAEAPG